MAGALDFSGWDMSMLAWEVAVEQLVVCPRLKGGKDGALPSPRIVDGKPSYSSVDLRGHWKTTGSPSRKLRELWESCSSDALKEVLQSTVLVKAGGGPCFLDGDRSALVEDIGSLVGGLDRGELEGNAFGRLVIGPKGTGKSSFLQALVLATQHLSRHILAVWCDVGSTHKSMLARSPSRVIAHALQLAVPTIKIPAVCEDDVVLMLNFLAKLGLRLFLVLDEFPVVFSLPADEGAAWTTQVYQMGQRASKPATHLCVIGGSAPYARAMCFGHLPVDPHAFPSYNGKACNLNSERFSVRMLGPLLSREAFEAFLSHSAPQKKRSSEALVAAFVATGGVHRRLAAMHALMRENKPIPTSDKLYKITAQISKFEPLLSAMLSALTDSHEEAAGEGTVLNNPWALVNWIKWDALSVLLRDMPQPERYQAADDGAIIYEQSEAGDRVRFVSPLHAIILSERTRAAGGGPAWFDARARAALRFPYSVLGIEAEDILRRSMVEQQWDLTTQTVGSGGGDGTFCDLQQVVTWTKKTKTRLARINAIKCGDVLLTTASPDDIPWGVALKETPDRAGADLIIFIRKPEPTPEPKSELIQARLQVKLGDSTLGLSETAVIIAKLTSGRKNVEGFLKRTKHLKLMKVQLYLLTTRRCTEGTVHACASAGVTLLQARDVAKCWAPCVREWAAASLLPQYLLEAEVVGGAPDVGDEAGAFDVDEGDAFDVDEDEDSGSSDDNDDDGDDDEAGAPKVAGEADAPAGGAGAH